MFALCTLLNVTHVKLRSYVVLRATSGCGQEIDWINDRDRDNIFLGPEVERANAVDDLIRKCGRPHVARLQLTERHGPIRFDRQAQDHLPAQCRIVAQFPIVESIQSGLVAIENNLDFFISTARRDTA